LRHIEKVGLFRETCVVSGKLAYQFHQFRATVMQMTVEDINPSQPQMTQMTPIKKIYRFLPSALSVSSAV